MNRDLYRNLYDSLYLTDKESCFFLRPNENYSYWQAVEKVEYYYQFFLERGYEAGDVLAVEAKKEFDSYCFFIACALYGITYVPFSADQSLFRLSDALTKISVREVYYYSAEVEFWVEENDFSGSKVADISVTADAGVIEYKEYPSDLLQYIMFSSGSTGTPKVIPISRGNLISYIDSINELYEFEKQSGFSQVAPLTFDLSIHDVYICFSNGGYICPIHSNEAILSYRFIRELGINYWMSVPSTASFIFQRLKADVKLPSLKLSFFLGEALPVDTARKWSELGGKVISLYGPTECTVAASYFRVDDWTDITNAIVPMGYPLSHVKTKIDPERSELLLGGNQLFPGYITDDPHLNCDRFLDIEGFKYYRSGDAVEYSDDYGYLFKGRLDFQVKIRGYRVELEEVEALASKILDCNVCAVPVDQIEIGNYGSITLLIDISDVEVEGDVYAIVRRVIPNYINIANVVIIETLPMNKNGKLDRKRAMELI